MKVQCLWLVEGYLSGCWMLVDDRWILPIVLLLEVLLDDTVRVFYFDGILHAMANLFPDVLREFHSRIGVVGFAPEGLRRPGIPYAHRSVQRHGDVLISLRNE